MEDILRKIYSGEYSVEGSFKWDDETFIEADKKTTELSDKYIAELKSKGIENAEQVLDDWINAYYTLTREELIVVFKKGVAFGFNLAKEIEEI